MWTSARPSNSCFFPVPRISGVRRSAQNISAVAASRPRAPEEHRFEPVKEMPRCHQQDCQVSAGFNTEGSYTARYCKQHAADGMVNIVGKRCSHDACAKLPSFNVQGSKTPKYCKPHAEDGMVNVLVKRCSYDACMTMPSFNVEGSKRPAFCKKHADDSMVNLFTKHCMHESCTCLLYTSPSPRDGLLSRMPSSA